MGNGLDYVRLCLYLFVNAQQCITNEVSVRAVFFVADYEGSFTVFP